MAVSEKTKTSNNKIQQNKDHYDLDKQTAKVFGVLSENVDKYEFLTGEGVSPEMDLLEKAATINKLEYSPSVSELKKQTVIAKKQYQVLDQAYEIDENGKD